MATATLAHDRNGLAATIEDTGKICLNGSIPFLDCQLVNGLENANACVVHQDIEPPESRDCLLNHAATLLVLANIRHRSICHILVPERVEMAQCHSQHYWIAAADEHAGALSNQSLGNAQSDAPGAACYQRYLLLKFHRHRPSSCKSRI